MPAPTFPGTISPPMERFRESIAGHPDKWKEEAKAEEAVKDIVLPSPNNDAVYYGADIYGGTWKKVTGPLSSEEAILWVETTASSNVYGKSAPWGLYTESSTDAFFMAAVLGKGLPVPDTGNIGEYSHFHVHGRVLKNKYKHFHVWYGELN